jgi:sugar lactone lactonase YvrE
MVFHQETLLPVALVLGAAAVVAQEPAVEPAVEPESAALAVQVGDPLERIRCAEGYRAFVYAVGLSAPDGLAFAVDGRVCVVEETAGRVTMLDADGRKRILAEGLRSPEGLCSDGNGGFWVVEDRADGRLAHVRPKQEVEFQELGLDAPEGVLLLGRTLYITESTLQLEQNPLEARTRILAFTRGADGWGEPEVLVERGLPFSFTELVADGTDRLVVVNEMSGGLFSRGLLSLNLSNGELKTFARGLITPEGICPAPAVGFPLHVAEEDLDGKGNGRISRVDADGRRTSFAVGFETVEDVLVAADGRIYVSEDATGLVVVLRPAPAAPHEE